MHSLCAHTTHARAAPQTHTAIEHGECACANRPSRAPQAERAAFPSSPPSVGASARFVCATPNFCFARRRKRLQWRLRCVHELNAPRCFVCGERQCLWRGRRRRLRSVARARAIRRARRTNCRVCGAAPAALNSATTVFCGASAAIWLRVAPGTHGSGLRVSLTAACALEHSRARARWAAASHTPKPGRG